jgi:hypothetical protein
MATQSARGPLHDRRLALSIPIVVSFALVLVAASVAVWLIIGPGGTGPIGQASPSAVASVPRSSDANETAGPTVTPTPVPTVTPTPMPTPTPVAQWTGLTWSEPLTPSFTVHLYDLLPWDDGYVAVGTAPEQGSASFTSPDGLHWTVEQRDFPGVPRHLVALGDELLAFMPETYRLPDPPGGVSGAPPTTVISRSTDGATWTPVDSPSWQDAWHEAVVDAVVGTYPDGWDQTQHHLPLGVVDVASGPDGLVAIGNSFGDDAMAPIILQSSDGATWTPAELPSGSESALLNAVVAHAGRFVVTGATGVWTEPATVTTAAWYSDDGLTWVRATVEQDEFGGTAGAEFGPLWAADNGLLTCRGNREMTAGGWRYMDAWLSPDGATWQYAPQSGPHAACDWSASDGTRIVSLGPRDHASPMPWPGVTVASLSTDGVTWHPLELSSTLTDRLERFWVVPDGVIYAGEQSFWFGTAITP